MAGLFEFLICWFKWAVITTWSYAVDAFTLILTAVIAVVNLFLALLPHVALEEPSLDSGLVGHLNYFIPFGPLMAEFGVIMVAWIIYRIYQWLLKFAKADG
jgi:hypothetical protein